MTRSIANFIPPGIDFANIYLAESHVKHHIITRGFLETVNWELKSAGYS